MSLLSVENLSYRYGKRTAVDSVSFHISRGEIYGLLGPNGAGKSTTIACVSGLLKEYSGNLNWNERPFRPSQSTSDRSAIGLVPQELAIYENLTGRENLRLFAQLAGVRRSVIKERVETYLNFAGLVDRGNDLVCTFSGGMKRRLNLAAGLIHEPSLVFLDEPTVGVDPQSRNHLFDSIARLKSDGISVLYTTHYMEEAERLCDRVAIMNAGCIIASGTPTELISGIDVADANLETVFLHLTGKRLRDE
jgi:ABC-2 type transport system ATP-binding protein